MKSILLSLLAVSSLISLPLPALADGVYIQAGPLGFSVNSGNNNYPIQYRPHPYGRRAEYFQRQEYRPYPYGRRAEYFQRQEYRPYPYGRRAEYFQRQEFQPRPYDLR